jgi:hypothetical protein
MRLGQPETHLLITSNAFWVLEFVLQCDQGSFRDAPVDRRRRHLVAESLG